MILIEDRVKNLKEQINLLAIKYHRNENDIKLIAVSKFQSIENILKAYGLGIRDFGENYIQEWSEKEKSLVHLKDIRWHLIGHLQKNKAKFLSANIHCLQSLDSIQLAQEIEKKVGVDNKLKVLIQLQVDKNDLNKSGISFVDAQILCEYLRKSKKLDLCGFMGIGPQKVKDEEYRKDLYMRFVKNARDLWNDSAHGVSAESRMILSLGMSHDMETAIECGSNMLRIGTGIFGERRG